MKLEKFKKNNLRDKKILYSIVGVILLIGGFVLFQTFALFESKYEFNIIKGKVNEFNKGDIELSFTIDGVNSNINFPNKDDGYAAKSVTCSNGTTAEWDNNLWGLINVVNNGTKKISCNVEFITPLYNVVKIGDYVSYTPSKTSYTVPKSLTGYSSDQTINPSELDVWRVIKKNETDKTIEMISEYVSNTEVYFYGQTGYDNYYTTLDTIAKQHETEGITSGSRFMNSTTDIDLVKSAMSIEIGLKAHKKGINDYSKYWLRNKFYEDRSLKVFQNRAIWEGWFVNIIDLSGKMGEDYFYRRNTWADNIWEYYTSFGSLRPIVKVTNNVAWSGDGSSTSPYKIN